MLKDLELLLTSPAFGTFNTLATFVGLIAALVSLRLARNSVKDGKAIIGRMEDVVTRLTFVRESLTDVGNSLTTHRVGESPIYLKELTRLVSDSKESVQITSIYHNVGVYTAPREWVLLENAIRERISQGVKFSLLYASRRQRRIALEFLFHEAKNNWAAWSVKPKNADDLREFAAKYRYRKSTFDQFGDWMEFLLIVQDRIVGNLYKEQNVEVTDDFVPLISWIRDDSEAFFAIANSQGNNTGFVTRDQNMIRSFKSVRERYSRFEQPVPGFRVKELDLS